MSPLLVPWFPHEQPHRAPDSYAIWCLGPCPTCHLAALRATRHDGDGQRLLRGRLAVRIITRTRPRRNNR